MALKIFKDYEKIGNDYPKEAVQYALDHREEAIPELLEILDNIIIRLEKLSLQEYDEDDENETNDMIITREFKSFNEENGTKFLLMSKETTYILYYVSVYLLAYFRETSAYTRVIKIASMKDIVTLWYLDITGTDELSKIMASVCDGDIEPIKNIIKDEAIDGCVRMDALQSLLIFLRNDMISRDDLVLFFKELLNSKLVSENIYFAEFLCTCCAIIHPQELMEDIDKAVKEGHIALSADELLFIDLKYNESIQKALEKLKGDFNYEFITLELVNELEDWCFYESDENFDSEDDDEDYDDDDEDYDDNDDEDYDDDDGILCDDDAGSNYNDSEEADFDASMKTLLQSVKKLDMAKRDDKFEQIFKNDTETSANASFTGRNDPCPCSSGKKYKKCCIDKNKILAIDPAYKQLYERNKMSTKNKTVAYNKEGFVSGMLLKYIEPLLLDKPTIDEYKDLLAFATATWNISLLPEHLQQTEVAKMIKNKPGSKLSEQKTIKITIKYLINRKKELFPDINISIIDFEVKMVNGEIKVYVASVTN